MSTLILVRPGVTDFDEQHRIQGSLNLPLNDRGFRQVEQTAIDLKGIELDIIYSSPCEPAKSTAEWLGEQLRVPVKVVDDLVNWNHGLWQGLQVEELRQKHPKLFKQWQDAPDSICPPSGETLNEVLERVGEALERPLKKKQNAAFVASEPLATIVCCWVKGTEITGIGPDIAADDRPRWEYLRVNGTSPVTGLSTINGVATINGVPANNSSTNGSSSAVGGTAARGASSAEIRLPAGA